MSRHLYIYLLESSLSLCSTRLTNSARPLLLPSSLPFSIFLPDDILDEIACQLADRKKVHTIPSARQISKPYKDLANFRLVSRRCNVSSTLTSAFSSPLLCPFGASTHLEIFLVDRPSLPVTSFDTSPSILDRPTPTSPDPNPQVLRSRHRLSRALKVRRGPSSHHQLRLRGGLQVQRRRCGAGPSSVALEHEEPSTRFPRSVHLRTRVRQRLAS